MKKYQIIIIALALLVITVVLYAPVRHNDFIDFDDNLYITDNPFVQAGPTRSSIEWAFTTDHAYNWHPLTWISHMLDCRIFGLKPAGHHLVNVVFHALNSVLLLMVLYRMTRRLWPSAFVAALFALHPLHVESVAWASERKDVLSTFFWMLTMWFYLGYARRPGFMRYLFVAFVFALGLLAKQMLVTLPLVLLLLDYWPLRRFPVRPIEDGKTDTRFSCTSFVRCLLEKLPLLCLSAAASVIVYLVQAGADVVKTTVEVPLIHRLTNALLAYGQYILKMFFPIHLGILYPHPQGNIPLWKLITAGLFLIAVTVVIIRYSRSRPYLIVGWLWYLGTLVPVIGLIQVGLQGMADRYTYIPLIGLFIIIAWTGPDLVRLLHIPKITLPITAVTILLILSILTALQLRRWKNSITLYSHTVAVIENNDMLHYNLGKMLLREGRIDEAIEHLSASVNIRPAQPTAHRELAVLLDRRGRLDEAIEHYRQVLKYKPDDRVARENLLRLPAQREKANTIVHLEEKAYTLAKQKKYDEAVTCYNELLSLDPDYVPAYVNLGNIMFIKGKLDAALANYLKVIELEPDQTDAHFNLALLYDLVGQKDQALKSCRKVLEIDPDNLNARQLLDKLTHK